MNYHKEKSNMKEILLLLDSLTLYKDVINREPFDTFKALIEELDFIEPDFKVISKRYHELASLLANKNWYEFVLEAILNASNEFCTINSKSKNSITPQLKAFVERDLNILQKIALVNPEELRMEANIKVGQQVIEYDSMLNPYNWPIWINSNELQSFSAIRNKTVNTSKAVNWINAERNRVKQYFVNLKSWSDGIDELADFYYKVGSGLFSTCVAFRWVSKNGGYLEGIDNPDNIERNQLIGQRREQEIIIKNTEYFLGGLPANNIILYGNRGTGKSSLVKALLNEYGPFGLRLVELHKTDLIDYHSLLKTLKLQNSKFIIFIDDLSFDDSEPEYKALKTLLEGGIEVRPSNIIIYATSNRRHLIKETFLERQGEEVHVKDNQEEKLSLADRFGITVTFPSPNQEEFLKIVEGLAVQDNLQIEHQELRQQALRWIMMHNGRSGRTARQFIDFLIGEQSLSSKI